MIVEHLTRRQAEVLQAVDRLISANGYSPTFREVGDEVGIVSLNGVSDHLRALKKKGWVDWIPMKSRTLRILSRG